MQLMKDIALLDKMYEVNLTYYKELAMYVLAGKQKLAETRNGELQELKNKAMASGLAEDAQAAKDLDSRCERFEKKLHDLELTKTIAMQTAPQIRLVQGNDTMMAEKNPVYTRQYDPTLEKPDGTRPWCRTFRTGSRSPERGQRYEQ